MRLFQHTPILAFLLSCTRAQDALLPPTMELLYSMTCDLGKGFLIGSVPHGQARYVIPIIGGTFKGPRVSGKVLNVGADWLLVDSHGIARPDTRYNLQTDDGAYIYVQTEGPTLKDGRILLRGKFEAGTNGTYSWMNEVVAVGVLTPKLTGNGTDQVLINMWQVNV